MAPCRTSDALLKANQNLMAILTKPEDDARQAQQTNSLYPPRSTSTGLRHGQLPTRVRRPSPERSLSPSLSQRRATAALVAAADSCSRFNPPAVPVGKPCEHNVKDEPSSLQSSPSSGRSARSSRHSRSKSVAAHKRTTVERRADRLAKLQSAERALQANQAAMGEASRELDLISSDAQAKDRGNDNWVQVFKAAVEKKVGTGAVQDKVLMNLSEQAMALGAEKAQLMFMLQKRTSEMEHIIADRDARIQQARDASQLGQRAIQESVNMQTNSMRLLLNKKQAQVQALQEQQVVLQNELQVATSKLDAAAEDGEGNSAASAARAYTHSLQQRVKSLETQLAEGATVSREQVEKSLHEQEQARGVLQARLAETLEQLGEANEETVQQASTAAQLASQIDELHSHRTSLEGEVATLRSRILDFRAQAERQTHRADAAEQAAAGLEANLHARTAACARLQQALTAQTEVLRQLQADLDDLGGVFDAAQAGALLDDERLEHAQIVTRLKKELAVQAATSARLRASLEQRCDVMQKLISDAGKHESIVNALNKELATQAVVMAELQSQLEERDHVIKRNNNERVQTLELVNQLREELQRQAGTIGGLRSDLHARTDALQQLLEDKDSRSEEIRMLKAELARQAELLAEARTQADNNAREGPAPAVARLHAQLQEQRVLVDDLKVTVADRNTTISRLDTTILRLEAIRAAQEQTLARQEHAATEQQRAAVEQQRAAAEQQAHLQAELHQREAELQAAVAKQAALRRQTSLISTHVLPQAVGGGIPLGSSKRPPSLMTGGSCSASEMGSDSESLGGSPRRAVSVASATSLDKIHTRGDRASIASSREMDDFVEHLTRISNQVAVAQQVLHTPLAPATRKSGIKAAFKRFGRKMGSLS